MVLHLTERCPICKGNAKVSHVGHILKKCDHCSGTGYIRHEKANPEDIVPVYEERIRKPPKPKGMPRKGRTKIKLPQPEDRPAAVFDVLQNELVNTGR